jgi:hypothetical protein
MACRLFRKAVQQGRSERRGDAYSVQYVEPLSDARTPLAGFVNSLLNKPGSFFRSRHTARVRPAHPLIAIPSDNTVDHISKRPGNDDEGIHPGPNPRKAAKNFEGRRGFREDPSVFQQ